MSDSKAHISSSTTLTDQPQVRARSLLSKLKVAVLLLPPASQKLNTGEGVNHLDPVPTESSLTLTQFPQVCAISIFKH